LIRHRQKPKTDLLNPDQTRRKEPVLGLVLLKGFTYHKDRVWEGGEIYDARSGKTYHCKLTLKNKNRLDVRGGMAWMGPGRTTTWFRVEAIKTSAKL